MEKRPKISKKYREIALFSLSQWGGGERGNGKKTENSTFKRLSAIFVPCLKIQGSHVPPDPHGRRPE